MVICHDDDITLYKAQVVHSAYPSKPNFTGGQFMVLLFNDMFLAL